MSLKKKTISGLKWSFTSQGGKQACQFVITAILARLLSPKDFGLLGMVTVFTGFFSIFGELGISAALIQRQNIDEEHLSSAFWLNIFVGILLTVFFALASPLIANFYNMPMLKPILIVISFSFFLSSFSIVQQAILTKEMNFKSLALRDISAVILAGIVGIYFAYTGYGVWSLVYQLLTYTTVNCLLLWTLSTWRPKFVFSFIKIKEIFNFSANIIGSQTINYVARNIDYLLIGKFLGTVPLGIYTLAYKLMLVPLQNISWIIGKVIFPAFSKIQDDIEKTKETYLKMIKSISLVTFPMMLGLFVIAPELINVVYGPKWEAAILIIRIFCFCGMIQSIGTTIGNILLSQGRADIQFKLTVAGTLFAALFISIGLNWGINGVAFLYTIFTFIWSFITFYITNKLIFLDNKLFYEKLIPSFITSTVMVFILLVAKNFIILPEFYKLISLVLLGWSIYMIFLIIKKEIVFKDGKKIELTSFK